jgi:hypothetical protein
MRSVECTWSPCFSHHQQAVRWADNLTATRRLFPLQRVRDWRLPHSIRYNFRRPNALLSAGVDSCFFQRHSSFLRRLTVVSQLQLATWLSKISFNHSVSQSAYNEGMTAEFGLACFISETTRQISLTFGYWRQFRLSGTFLILFISFI